ncbi:hypothetical protein GP486_006898, partial [Trichoglossum hirsutum]
SPFFEVEISFGFAVSDFIAVLGLAERLCAEIKSYRQAPAHLEQLGRELGFLHQVLSRLDQITPSAGNDADAAQIERMKAIATHCRGPLKSFIDRMGTFEEFLGCHRVERSLKGMKKRLHWSISVSKNEVGDVRAIVVSQILAINTLLNAQQWESLRNSSGRNETTLQRLIADITGFAQRLELCFKSQSQLQAQIKQLIDLAAADKLQWENKLKSQEKHINTSNSLVRRLGSQYRRSSTIISKIKKHTSKSYESTMKVATMLEEGLKSTFNYV